MSHEQYVLADGSSIMMDTTVGQLEFEGKIVGGTIVFGDAHAEPLLGATALESGGFEVDPRTQKLKRLPAILLKGALRCGQTPGPQILPVVGDAGAAAVHHDVTPA